MARYNNDLKKVNRDADLYTEEPMDELGGGHALTIPEWLRPIWSLVRGAGVVLVSLLIVGGISFTVVNKLYNNYVAPVDSENITPIEFKVERGSSLSKISEQLKKQGLVRNAGVFKYYVDFTSRADKLQSGTYQFSKAMTMDQIVDQLMRGDGLPKTAKITVTEGLSINEMARYLYRKEHIKSAADFMKIARNGELFLKEYEPIAAVMGQDLASERRYPLEGYLFPATYEIYVDASNETIIRKMLTKFMSVYFRDEIVTKAETLGLTTDQVVTLASLIEKEGNPVDFAKISAVFHNRMKKDMKLESDASLRYALGDETRLILTDKEKKLDSLYNTHWVKGLPLGPICSPGQKAIEAAVNPDPAFLEEGVLYFVRTDPKLGRDVSNLAFAKTKDEYKALLEQYRPLWEAYDQEQEK